MTRASLSRNVIWHRILDGRSNEFCELRARSGGSTLCGWIVAEHEREPLLVTWRATVSTDLSRVRSVEVACRQGSRLRRLRIAARSRGTWLVDGRRQRAFDGCTDVDLEWTPATNLFPIRRMMLAQSRPGEALDVAALWVRMPQLAVERSSQRYTREGRDRFLYEGLGTRFRAVLRVDDIGLPLSYARIWRAVAEWRAAE